MTLTFILAALAVSASAATFGVTNTNDSGSGSLRQAVLDANAAAGADTINFAINAPATVILTSGALVINDDVTINGSSVHSTTISGNNASRVIEGPNGSADITLNYLNITGGRAPTGMGNNHDGGGIYAFGQLVISNCAIYANNSSQGTGGGIYNGGGLILTNSTISGNNAQISGGGLEGDFPSSTALIQDSTIAFNTSGTGGGVHNAQASVQVKNSIIAQNTATVQRPDFSLTMSSLGYNIIGNTSGANITGTQLGNQLNVNPGLFPLGANGGATLTHATHFLSVGVDHGDPNRLGLIDQRGTIRGTDGDKNQARGVDVGAYEKQRPTFNFTSVEHATPNVTREGSVVQQRSGREPEGGPPTLSWYKRNPNGSYNFEVFGVPTDIESPGDFDGDGLYDAAIFRPAQGNFYISKSTGGILIFHWGMAGDIPVPADYDGNGVTSFAIYRAGVFHITTNLQGYYVRTLGTAVDTPVQADYDGDSKIDPAVYHDGVWKIDQTGGGGVVTLSFGMAGDIAVPADYDADGKANLAVFRPANATWYIADPGNLSFTAQGFGLSTDKPVPADYDGDGKTDIAVFRSGIWWINNSRIGLTATQFGVATDFPVQSSYIY